jgi:hypothetical protein
MSLPTQEIDPTRAVISPEALERRISDLLDIFFKKRIDSLQNLKLEQKLKVENPYLFRAIGVSDASGIIEELLDAHISSSDETIFGNEFFEPLAKWVAAQSFRDRIDVTVQVSGAEGCDILVSMANETQAIAVKSGTKVFNAQSRRKQIDEFMKIDRILKKDRKLFLPIVGYCYGRKEQRDAKDFTEMAGQRLWEHLTGETDFYLRIIRLMKTKPLEHRPRFTDEYDKAKNRFVKEFLSKYSLQDGSIDWDQLAQIISEIKPPRQKPEMPARKKSKRNTGTVS